MKPKKISPIKWFILASIIALLGVGGFFALNNNDEDSEFTIGNNPKLPTLTFYTTGLATTPQLGFWHAVSRGEILKKCNLKIRLWKNLDDLRGAVLAGKGDLWLGHTDGFVQAGLRGAPIQLMITSGWRKFYLVSKNMEKLEFSDFLGFDLAVAPMGSPAVPVLKKIMQGQKEIRFIPHEPRQLATKLVKGDIEAAVVPEPLVSVLTAKVPGLKIGENLETLYGRYTKGEPRMPIAGIAVNSNTAKQNRKLIEFIANEIMDHSNFLAKKPLEGIETLPQQFKPFVKVALVISSMNRDLIYARLSSDVKNEIKDYIKIILNIDNNDPIVPDSLFWR